MWSRSLNHEKHTEDIGLECTPKLFFGDLGHILIGVLLAGIVDQHVNSTKGIYRAIDGILAKRLVADVSPDRDSLAAFGFHYLHGFLRVVVFQQIDDGNVRPFARYPRP